MIETTDHSEHRFANRLMTVIVETAEQQKACTVVRQSVQALQGIRHRRALTNTDFELQLLVLDRLSGMPVATVGLRSSHTGGEVEGEFDCRGLFAGNVDYLEINGPVMLPGHNPNEVLSQCMGLIGEHYADRLPQALLSRISLPLGGGDKYIQSLMFYLRNSHMCTSQARPRVPLRRGDVAYADDVILPGMLRAFLRYGACIASEPYWDAEQGRAEILVWVERERLINQPAHHQPGTMQSPEPQLSA